jgi:hypothetical protein
MLADYGMLRNRLEARFFFGEGRFSYLPSKQAVGCDARYGASISPYPKTRDVDVVHLMKVITPERNSAA